MMHDKQIIAKNEYMNTLYLKRYPKPLRFSMLPPKISVHRRFSRVNVEDLCAKLHD